MDWRHLPVNDALLRAIRRVERHPQFVASLRGGIDFRLILAQVKAEELDVSEFEISGEGIYQNHMVKFARRYTHSDTYFDLLVPEGADSLYVISPTSRPSVLCLQYCNHHHRKGMEDILASARYALFREKTGLPLEALVHGFCCFVIEELCVVSPVSYTFS